ncbi:hypothetical protein GQ53DRAFT_824458 [Thozetella sp. PMI_491]|nr:hypothetical protein GQ53DRAFT_824458 [Thozetella sp. PMI_491]
MTMEPTFTLMYRTLAESEILTEVYVPSASAKNSGIQAVPLMYVIHGGRWATGHPRMNPVVQIQDALDRGWIILAPDHRLCPQVNILEGPISDVRFLHEWLHAGHLDTELCSRSLLVRVDKKRVIASGIASGAQLCFKAFIILFKI